MRTGVGGSTSFRTLARPRTSATGRRLATLLRFELARARRMFVIVRGPVPSCRVVGVIPVRGRAGVNTVEFNGRVRGRTLNRGIYMLSISPVGRVHASDRPAAVRVVSARRIVPVKKDVPELNCTSRVLPAAGERITRGENAPNAAARGPAAPGPSKENSVFRPPTAPGLDDVEQNEAMGLPLPGLGSAVGTSGGVFESMAALAILALLGALLLGLVTLVARFLAGSWNP